MTGSPRWRHPALETRESDIAGRGTFTTQDLPAGTTVLRLSEDDELGDVDTLGATFPNHGCDPTLGWDESGSLVTMTDVAAGAELVTDYAMAIVRADWFLRCHCPSYRCRQMVEGSDWRIPVLQRRYAEWWGPAVRRLLDAG
jgi:hypothetical protein